MIGTYDAEFRDGFDRKITEWATDFMRRAHVNGKPFYVYLPYTQVYIARNSSCTGSASITWCNFFH